MSVSGKRLDLAQGGTGFGVSDYTKQEEFPMKRLTKETLVLVADGARGVLYRVEGDAGHPHLKEFRRYAQEDAPTRDQGTDRPGRINDSTGRRSAVETTDWHQLSEDAFIARIASELEGDLAGGDFSELVVVIPPVALGAVGPSEPLLGAHGSWRGACIDRNSGPCRAVDA